MSLRFQRRATFGRRDTPPTVGPHGAGLLYNAAQRSAPGGRTSLLAWLIAAAIVVVVAIVLGR